MVAQNPERALMRYACGSGPSWVGMATPRSHTRAMPAKKRAVYLNADLHRLLRTKSATMDLTVAELVSSAVRAYLADAADEPTFGKQGPTLSFRAARGKKSGKKRKKIKKK
jgi:hypothetical protein